VIRLDKVAFAYSAKSNHKFAIDNISLEIRPGENIAIIGPNGSGKSTLAKLLNALLRPLSGKITIDGMDTRDDNCKWEIRRLVGMVFQNPENQLLASSAEEEVAFGPENLGIPSEKIHQLVEESLNKVGLGGFRTAEPHKLSGGQKQRLAVAAVLAMKPKYLVLDEATSMLDIHGKQEILKTVQELHKLYRITVVNITHDMAEAALAERIVVLMDGRVFLEGSPHKVFAEYDVLHQAGLEVPGTAKLAQRLHQAGIPIPKGIINREKLVDELCSLTL